MLLYDSANFKNEYEEIVQTSPEFYIENPNRKNNYAYLTWRFSKSQKANNFKELGEGFLVSAIVSIEKCLENSTERIGDGAIYPILFNCIHGMELYFKATLFEIETYVTAQGGSFDEHIVYGHSVRGLYSKIIDYCRAYSLPYEGSCVIEPFMDMMFHYTEDVTFARYPYDSHASEHFYVSFNGNIAINMETYYKWCKALLYTLDRSYINLCGEIEAKMYCVE